MVPNNRISFTKTALNALPPPASGRAYYRDAQMPDLGLAITDKGTISFFVVTRTEKGDKRRFTLGRYPRLSIAAARTKAKKTLGKAAEGVDVVAAKRESRQKGATLGQCLDEYTTTKDLKPSTKKDYRRSIHDTFGDLVDKPLADITRDMVRQRYVAGGEKSKTRTANAARVLKALFNFAHQKNVRKDGTSLFFPNPVDVIRDLRIHYDVQRRKTVIHSEQLPKWWKAVEGLRNPIARDYLEFLLLTGCRKNEAATLTWNNVDLDGRRFRLIDTKNRETVELPLPEHIAQRLSGRKPDDTGAWVFPGHIKPGNYYDNPYTAVGAVRKATGIRFSPHDLRRTFISIAEGLDISSYSIKRLVNHKISKNDVTAGYIISSLDRLAKASKQIQSPGHAQGIIATLETAA